MAFNPLLSLALAAGLCVAGPASAYVAANGLVVRAEGQGDTFFVPFQGLSGDVDFWCAAGDYVNNFLRLPGGTRIYRLSPPPRRQGQGIRFSLNPEGAAADTGLSVFSSEGPANSVSAAMGYALCPPRFFFFFGRRGFF